MELITLTAENIAKEGICCAFSDKKHRAGVHLKQEWLKARFVEGLKYQRFNIRGKVFIEYIPAEYAWSPIDAAGYTFIHCFWTSGQYQGKGLGKQLFDACLNDSQGKNGIVVITGKKKIPFLVDKKFFLKQGFEVCDTAPPYFELLVKRFNHDAPLPTFRASVKTGTCDQKHGLTFVYSELCPFTTFWVEQMIGFAQKFNAPTHAVKIATRADAQNAPSPFTIFSLFYNGNFATHEMMGESKFDKLMNALRKI